MTELDYVKKIQLDLIKNGRDKMQIIIPPHLDAKVVKEGLEKGNLLTIEESLILTRNHEVCNLVKPLIDVDLEAKATSIAEATGLKPTPLDIIRAALRTKPFPEKIK